MAFIRKKAPLRKNDKISLAAALILIGCGAVIGIIVNLPPNQNPWEKVWTYTTDTLYATAFSIWGDGAGNLYTCGEGNVHYAAYRDMLLVKTDITGTVLWTRNWGNGGGTDIAMSVSGDGNGNIYTLGRTNGYGAGNFDFALVKWNSAGDLLWYRTWGGASPDLGMSVWVDLDGMIYTTGTTSSFGAGSEDLALIKWGPDGTQLWNRTWGGTSSEYGDIVKGDGQGYVYTSGETFSFDLGDGDIFVVKWDDEGTQIWNRTYPTTRYELVCGLWCDDNQVVVYSETQYYPSDYGETAVIKWDATGTQVWARTLDFPSSARPGYYHESPDTLWSDGTSLFIASFSYTDYEGEFTSLKINQLSGTGELVSTREWKPREGYFRVYSIWSDNKGMFYTCGVSGETESLNTVWSVVCWNVNSPSPGLFESISVWVLILSGSLLLVVIIVKIKRIQQQPRMQIQVVQPSTSDITPSQSTTPFDTNASLLSAVAARSSEENNQPLEIAPLSKDTGVHEAPTSPPAKKPNVCLLICPGVLGIIVASMILGRGLSPFTLIGIVIGGCIIAAAASAKGSSQAKKSPAVSASAANSELSPPATKVSKNQPSGLIVCPNCGAWSLPNEKTCGRCGQPC